MTPKWQRLALLAMTLAATGCGPTIPLDADVKEIGYDVFFGPPTALAPPAPTQSAPAPPAPVPVYIAPVGPAGAPPQISFMPAPSGGPACPTPSPLAYPAVAATLTGPTSVPAQATYPFRVTGSTTIDPGAADARISYYPTQETRQISNVTKPDSSGAFFYTVQLELGDASSTTTYHVYPNGPTNTQAGPAGAPAAGMYLTAFKDDAGTVFDPAGVGVEILAFPAIPANPYQGSGYDAVDQTSMVMNPPNVVLPGGLPVSPPNPPSQNAVPSGFVAKGSHLVDACGQVVDSVETEILGTFTKGSDTINFDDTFDTATQFGGIIIADHLVETGTDPGSGKPFKREVTSTINQVPRS